MSPYGVTGPQWVKLLHSVWRQRGRFNIKAHSYQYSDFHHKDETIPRRFYLNNESPIPERQSLYIGKKAWVTVDSIGTRSVWVALIGIKSLITGNGQQASYDISRCLISIWIPTLGIRRCYDSLTPVWKHMHWWYGIFILNRGQDNIDKRKFVCLMCGILIDFIIEPG